ncbi:PTS system trehalose-specific EIIBC component [Enterococcus durans]|uniref:PTS system sucrose-specific EIIBCA component n=2 Tax=Enterococcus durans TaxID=53345 RepID=A0AB36SBE0_9ENTE|nr:PTS system trehalose-specific EIIBC component [Enterococcus durans]EOT33696.1 PTS system, trehalose-specific IIBC component [Enterococcus durans ATCC 6056]EOU25531.1 PTS system, trehalose-specific IIBC component [Enterococcus durans ATCC 6056]PEH46224.1 PTS beta-glucoside transporter subunit EIIBCA [Enterococcus durans]QPQ27385.1 PTS system trehalose-specific EIIBC component [Enterococcus durans]QXB36653.1 PTS system trehalose-specific EIIBC component [Enterococcus durans]
MAKYQVDAEKLLESIGGKENIAAVSHCATRMRFVLNDQQKADEKAIEDIPSVKGMFTNAGQFQVIIGNDVATFYNDFVAVSGVEGVSKEQSKVAAKQNLHPVQRAIAVLAEIFTPLIPAIIVGGLILGFRNVLEGIQFASLGGTIVEHSQFWNGVNGFLWLPGEAIFHFLPVGITWSIAKKMGTTQILGIVLGITLVSPQLLNAYSVATTAADIPFWDFGFAQVIPAMLAGFMLAYLEIFFRKYIPQSISMIFVPLFSLVPTVLAAHVILGPIGWTIGSWISNVVNTGLTSSISWLFSAVFGFLYAPLVITGLHHMTNAIDMQLIADFGSTNLWPMIALSNIAQGSAVLAIIFLHRGNKKEEQISIPAMISCYLGVTEPAMFGINLKYVYPFVAAMVGSGLAGMFANLMGVRANAIGVGGLPGILAIQAQAWVPFIIAMVIAVIVPFGLTVIFRRQGILNKIDRAVPVAESSVQLQTADGSTVAPKQFEPVNTATTSVALTEELFAVADGPVKEIIEVDDPVFSQKMMGEGYAIEPSNNNVYAPVSGRVTSVFETQHAIGILSDVGLEVLVHMGLDTVELKGAPFTIHVKEGDLVTPNTRLAEMDLAAVEQAGKKTDILVVLTNDEKVAGLSLDQTGLVRHGEQVGKAKIK